MSQSPVPLPLPARLALPGVHSGPLTHRPVARERQDGFGAVPKTQVPVDDEDHRGE